MHFSISYETTTLRGTTEKLFKILSKIPESLLVLPILKILQSLTGGNANPAIPPALVASKKSFLKDEWKTKQSQR